MQYRKKQTGRGYFVYETGISAMASGRVLKMSRLVFGGLLILTLLPTVWTGCGRQVSIPTPSKDLNPFITDRVVTVRIVMKEEDWTATQQQAIAEQYVSADFWFDGELVPDVAVRPKGQSSLWETMRLGTPRFSLKVDFNLFNRARHFRGLKKVNLNNGWSDPTLIRERLCYELFAYMGIPTPRSSFVDLWVNETHLGVYTMVEQIDKTYLGRHFPKNDGNLYKPEMPAAFLDWTEADLEQQRVRQGITSQNELERNRDVNLGGGNLRDIMQALGQESAPDEAPTTGLPVMLQPPRRPPPGVPPPGIPRPAGQLPLGRPPQPGMLPGQQGDYLELMGLKTNENNPDHSALLHFLDILNNEPDETFPEEIEKVLDVDGALRFLAVSTLIVHLDNYTAMGHNYYLYDNDGKFVMLPWDLNMAFGTFNYGLDRDRLINYYIDEPSGGPMAERPLVNRLLSHQPYLDMYHDYLEELLDGPFSADRMNSRIDELAALVRPYVEADDLKFYSTADFERGLSKDIKVGGIFGRLAPIGLKAFVIERSKSVRQQLEGIRKSSSGDGSGNGGFFAPFEEANRRVIGNR